jgi:hypothetical protein
MSHLSCILLLLVQRLELAWLLRAKAPALDVSSPPYLLLDKLLIITRTNWTWWLFFLIRSVVSLLEGIRRRWSMGHNVSYPLQKANVFRPLETITMQDPQIVVTCGCCLTQGRISSQTLHIDRCPCWATLQSPSTNDTTRPSIAVSRKTSRGKAKGAMSNLS